MSNDVVYPDNLVTIKRVNNGYLVTKANTAEFDDEGEDGEFIYPNLPHLIAALAEIYKGLDE